MFQQLPHLEYGNVASLFEPLNHLGILTAVLAQHRQGKLFVDNLDTPQTAFVWSPGVWCFLAGNANNERFNESLRTALFNQGISENEVSIWLCVCDSEAWKPALSSIARPRQLVLVPRLYYRCDTLQMNGWDCLPDGFTALPVDAELLSRTDVKLPQDVSNWIAEIGTPAEFFANSFGFVAMHGRDVVSWCMADGIAGLRTELGIYTKKEFQQRGLATALTALAVEYAFSRGLTEVTWQCNVDNTPSIRTAEKVGFHLIDDYTMLAFLSDADNHTRWLERLGVEEATAV
ncbi:MAG: GNAT family N-acetyltransferase [Anaerolineae bacterium]|nr:GNAT family N-acetyltransferase [Anaerolineae bacterium]